MQQVNTADSGSRALANRDRSAFGAVALVSLLVVAGLWAISRDADSAVQLDDVVLKTDSVSGEEGCSNFAGFWMVDSGAHVPGDAIAGLSNCRMDDRGVWFVPTSADDPRLPDTGRLSVAEQALVAPLEQQLHHDLDDLDSTLPRSLKESLKANYSADNQPVFGHTRRGRTDLGAKRARYIRVTQAYLVSPDRVVLADYAGWIMARRNLATGQFETACHANPDLQFLLRACDGVRNEFAVGFIPLYWELTDPVLIEEYLVYRARSGKPIPVPDITVVPA